MWPSVAGSLGVLAIVFVAVKPFEGAALPGLTPSEQPPFALSFRLRLTSAFDSESEAVTNPSGPP